jgi:acyl dehydratase
MHVGLARVGHWTDETAFTVTADGIAAYAAATNDDHPLYAAGVMAPPLFAVVPVGHHIGRALDGMVAEEDRRWGVHAAQDTRFHAPFVPGMTVQTRAAPVGVQPKPLGTSVLIRAESRAGGALLTEHYVTLLFRRKFSGPAVGEDAPDHRALASARHAAQVAGRIITIASAVAEDQAHRYAQASGDHNPIHLDPEFARSVGLPGIILHGMCTMAFAGRAAVKAVCGDDPRRLRRLAVRFARPVLPGQTISTRLWPVGHEGGTAAYAFDTINPEGKAVLVDGLAEAAPRIHAEVALKARR